MTAAADKLSDTAIRSAFLNARRESDDRTWYADKTARMWRAVACGACVVAVMSLAGNWMQISRSRFEVHMVAVDGSGREVGNWPAGEKMQVTDQEKRARLEDWIVQVRAVTVDESVARRYVAKLFASVGTGSAADVFLKEYYAGGASPLKRALTCTVDPEVESVLPISDKTYQVRWKETTRNLSGEVQGVERWTAAITLAISPAKSSLEVNKLNGLGLYVTAVSWSKITT